jgi:signal transduction histidine kinase
MPTPATPEARAPQQAATQRLTRRYSVALITIALLGILGQLIVQISIRDLSRDTHVIDVAARERMLSERLTKAALALQVNPYPLTQSVYIDEIRAVEPEWSHAFVALQTGDARMGLPGNNSAAVQELFDSNSIAFNVMKDAIDKVLLDYDERPAIAVPGTPDFETVIIPFVDGLLVYEPGFSSTMDRIASQYQTEADARVDRLRTIEWTLLGVELAVIALLVVVVFRPATEFVGRSIRDLVLAQEREHELAALKDQFIVDANHELRTPIMALYNNLEILQALGDRGAPEQSARILQRAVTAGDAVLRLLHRVLDTSALEGKALRLEPQAVQLAALVRSVLETFDPSEIGEPDLMKEGRQIRSVTMHVPDDLVVWADEGRVRQILVNLVGNALKYSAAGSPIELSADAQAPAVRAHRRGTQEPPVSSMIQINVHDHGLGIPAADANKLFNRFVRLERDIAGSVRGTGVGLYMCRVLAEAMGGRIWVESPGIPGEGSTFSFALPAVPPAVPAPALAGPDAVIAAQVV